MHNRIVQPVTNNSRQKPVFLPIQYADHDVGEFVFVRKGTDLSTLPYLPPAPVVDGPREWRYLVGLADVVLAGGMGFGLLMLVRPRTLRKQQAMEVWAAIKKRDLACLATLAEWQDGRLPAAAAAALRSSLEKIDGICLLSGSRKIVVCPVGKQGLGRGENWLFSVDDPPCQFRRALLAKLAGGLGG